MRAVLAFACFAALAVPAASAEVVEIDGATLDAVTGLATRGYTDPAAAVVRNVHKSAAANGMGYCGEVTIEGGDGETFTVFHAIIEGGSGPSVLRAADYPADPGDPNATVVARLMRNFGCTE